MKALKKNDMGVSPVIAVILMVAITVVLAGVVFLWASSLTGDRDDAGDLVTVDAALNPTTLTITPTTGNLDWAVYDLIFDGAKADADTDGITSTGMDYTVTGTYTVGTEYDYKIVDTENDKTIASGTVLCKNP
ncbi:MAG: type IV pilin [Thermoplasmatota archaeon]